MKIPDLHKEILELFNKYKFPWDTDKLHIPSLYEWSDGVSQLLNVDKQKINSRMSELFWAMSSVQLSLGYALVSRQTCSRPKGFKGEFYNGATIPLLLGISEIHLFYHLNNAWESIYRCWERITSLLHLIFLPECNDKLYFDEVVLKLSENQNYSNNPKLNNLKSQIKYWNKAAKKRNRISHFESAPMKKMQYQPGLSKIYGSNQEYIPKISLSLVNILNDINEARDSYKRIFPAIIDAKEFTEYVINKNLGLQNK